MAGRKRIYGSSTSPRYRLKMYRYLSEGGRLPMVLVMEVVDAMDTSWSGGFFKYKDIRDRVFNSILSELEIPKPYHGICKALGMKVWRLHIDRGLDMETAVRRIMEEHGLTGDEPIGQFLQALIPKAEGSPEGEARPSSKT